MPTPAPGTGLKFIGPSGDVIRKMGNKAAARALMQAVGVPVVPGSDGAVVADAQAQGRWPTPSATPCSSRPPPAAGAPRGMRRVSPPEEVEANV